MGNTNLAIFGRKIERERQKKLFTTRKKGKGSTELSQLP